MYISNIESLLNAVKNVEIDDLRRALIACGRNYTFDTENNPVEIVYDEEIEPRLASVVSVRLDPQARIHIYVYDRNNDIDEISLQMIYPGQISNITKHM